jgi:hypothetical protein
VQPNWHLSRVNPLSSARRFTSLRRRGKIAGRTEGSCRDRVHLSLAAAVRREQLSEQTPTSAPLSQRPRFLQAS